MAFSDSGISPGKTFRLKYAKFYDIVVVVFTFYSPTLPAERKLP